MHMLQTNLRPRSQSGFSLIELLIVISIILIISAIAIPNFAKIQQNASETAVIQEIRTIHTAQIQYHSQFQKYAASLAELGPPTTGGIAGAQAAELLPKSLAEGKKSGYVFLVATAPTGYTITAMPEVFGSTGRRTFFSDQTQVLHQNWGQEPATANSPDLP
jgi:type IV pilus assembly protein PilA